MIVADTAISCLHLSQPGCATIQGQLGISSIKLFAVISRSYNLNACEAHLESHMTAYAFRQFADQVKGALQTRGQCMNVVPDQRVRTSPEIGWLPARSVYGLSPGVQKP